MAPLPNAGNPVRIVASKMDNPQKAPKNNYSFQMAETLSIVFEMGLVIALPIVVLGLGGKWLDRREHTQIFVYAAIVLALLISTVWLYKRFDALIQKLKDASEKSGKKDK